MNQFLKAIGHSHWPTKEGGLKSYLKINKTNYWLPCEVSFRSYASTIEIMIVTSRLSARFWMRIMTTGWRSRVTPMIHRWFYKTPLTPTRNHLCIIKWVSLNEIAFSFIQAQFHIQYKWVLRPISLDQDNNVQYSIQNEWTLSKNDYVTTFSKNDNVDNQATANRANQLFYVNQVATNQYECVVRLALERLSDFRSVRIVPVDRTDKMFGVKSNKAVKLVSPDPNDLGYDKRWKIIAL